MTIMKALIATAAFVSSFATAPAFAQDNSAETLTSVMERGVLRVGVLGVLIVTEN
ncbi:hypothetical protein J3456_19195 [Sulfitobacter sp. NFXS29]|uniref:hypothetical protein n=1 Tax=Sulfitobacter sp. NFXS29 TaxID=2818438 RepID=UPI0032DE4327